MPAARPRNEAWEAAAQTLLKTGFAKGTASQLAENSVFAFPEGAAAFRPLNKSLGTNGALAPGLLNTPPNGGFPQPLQPCRRN
jgi:hypothetical protein